MTSFAMDNPVVRALMFHTAVVTGKMLLMALLTAKQRFTKGVFANREDRVSKSSKVAYDDQDVERVRRNHLNDLENIPAFIFTAIIYTLTDPTLTAALWHFRLFTISRIIHTISYQLPLPQPCRALSYAVGVGSTLSMLVQTILHVW